MKNVGIVLLCILLIGALAVPAMAGEGCSQGFWRHHPDEWPAGFFPETTTVLDAFGYRADNYSDHEGDTLMEALRYHGGKGIEGATKILLRQATAAMLNAASPFVDYNGPNESEIILAVNAALDTGAREEITGLADELASYNEEGCPELPWVAL